MGDFDKFTFNFQSVFPGTGTSLTSLRCSVKENFFEISHCSIWLYKTCKSRKKLKSVYKSYGNGDI